MYLSESRYLRILTLCGLYVAQGVPYGFVTVTFAAWLAQDKHNLSTEQLGPILAVATLPWSFKFLWGPLMDAVSFPKFGRRRPWIILAQSLAIVVLSSLLLSKDLPGMVWTSADQATGIWQNVYHLVPGPLAAMILLANVFVSMQDVAVDALAVDLLSEKERGIANGLMYGSSYLGTALGGAGLGTVVGLYGIQAGLLGQAVILGLIMLLPILIRERPGNNAVGDRPCNVSGDSAPATAVAVAPPGATPADNLFKTPDAATKPQTGAVVLDLLRAFSLRSTILGTVVALSCRLCLAVITTVLLDFLLKQGGWTQQQYTDVNGGYAVFAGLLGAVKGGYLADRMGTKRMILLLSLLIGGLWCVYGMNPDFLYNARRMTEFLIMQEYLFSMYLVTLFSMFMSISWPRVAATQFTAYMAFMNLSTTAGSYIAGWTGGTIGKQAHNGIPVVLIVAAVAQAVIMVPVLFIDQKQTRRVLGEK